MPRIKSSGHLDRRIEKTRNLLTSSLMSLIGEKPYDSIAIKEILHHANVGRSTFYMHFRDKDDLLRSGIDRIVGGTPSVPGATGKLERFVWFSLPIFQHHAENARGWVSNIGTHGRTVLHDRLRHALAEVILFNVEGMLNPRTVSPRAAPADLLANHVACTFVMVLDWWLDKQMPLGPDEVNRLFRSLVEPTLKASIDPQ
jgi:AcrR family transcriptional regulator